MDNDTGSGAHGRPQPAIRHDGGSLLVLPLLVPNIEVSNMVYKNLAFTADVQIAGLIVGARVPVILTRRAGTAATRRFSAAAVLYAHTLARDPVILLPETAE
jgi:hypothetical protein